MLDSSEIPARQSRSERLADLAAAISVDGPGVRDARTPDLRKGQKAALTVTLKKGTYDLYCPVDGHRQLGMEQHIHVG
ncbi:hypothetical protein [Streptomyces collinus]|uniref:hypothetical protein n=1 Tax=Streptomyces collinus TaxID=42684 RepID=UPI00362E0000